MKFLEILKSNHWLSVCIILLELYPDQAKMIDEYERVFGKLKEIEPIESGIQIVLKNHTSDVDDSESYVEVSGLDLSDTTHGLALDFTPWNKWLGMDLSQETIENFTELEIIAHCLWEMTFVGFDEVYIQNELIGLQKSIDEYENMTDEEKKRSYKSIDELFKELDIDNDTDEKNN